MLDRPEVLLPARAGGRGLLPEQFEDLPGALGALLAFRQGQFEVALQVGGGVGGRGEAVVEGGDA
ncbi:hypothetical protein GCM10023238_33050 [Streptomyces heliomycini]